MRIAFAVLVLTSLLAAEAGAGPGHAIGTDRVAQPATDRIGRLEARVDSCCADKKAPIYRPYRPQRRLSSTRAIAKPEPQSTTLVLREPAADRIETRRSERPCCPGKRSWLRRNAWMLPLAIVGAALILRDHDDDEGVHVTVGAPPPSGDDDGKGHSKRKPGGKR